MYCCLPIGGIGTTAIVVIAIGECETYHTNGDSDDAIGNVDSPLRGNIVSYQFEGQCKRSVVEHSLRAEPLCGAKGKKRSSALSASAMQPQTMRLVSIRLLYVGKAATEEPQASNAAINGKRYAVGSQLFRYAPQLSAHCILFCPRPHREIIDRGLPPNHLKC